MLNLLPWFSISNIDLTLLAFLPAIVTVLASFDCE